MTESNNIDTSKLDSSRTTDTYLSVYSANTTVDQFQTIPRSSIPTNDVYSMAGHYRENLMSS